MSGCCFTLAVSSVRTCLFCTAMFWLWLLLGSGCSTGGRTMPLQGLHPTVASLMPLQLRHASVFILNFSPHGCQKEREDLYFKPSHSPCLCWGVVRQREWWSLGLRKLCVLFLTLTALCNLPCPRQDIYTANSMCVPLNTKRNYY